jgi:hypothetical protein
MATILAVQEIDVSSHIHVVGCEAPCDDCCAEPAHGLLPLIMIGHVSHLECHAGWRSQQTATAIGGWWLGGLTAATVSFVQPKLMQQCCTDLYFLPCQRFVYLCLWLQADVCMQCILLDVFAGVLQGAVDQVTHTLYMDR